MINTTRHIDSFPALASSEEDSGLTQIYRGARGPALLLCIACFMVCAADSFWLALPQNYGIMTDATDRVWEACYHVLLGSPVTLLVMASGIYLFSAHSHLMTGDLWKHPIPRFAVAYAIWALIYEIYRIYRMDPQPKITEAFLFQQWMVVPEHLTYLTVMLGLLIVAPMLRPIADSKNRNLFRYMFALFIGSLVVIQIYTWPGLPHGEMFIFPALEKTPVATIAQYFILSLLGWIAYNYRPSRKVRCLIYAVGIIAVLAGICMELAIGPAYAFGSGNLSVLNDFSLISFCKNMAIFFLAVTCAETRPDPDRENCFLQRLAGSTLIIYLIHYLILSIFYDNGFLSIWGISARVGIWIYAIFTYCIGAVIALTVRGIGSGLHGSWKKKALPTVCILVLFLNITVMPSNVYAEDTMTEEIWATQHVSSQAFQNSRTRMKPKKCMFAYNKLVLQWEPVRGAEEYQVWRSDRLKGEYKEFAVTDKTKLKEKSDGEFYYKVRAVNGKNHSQWSVPVHIYSQNGYIKKMYYDDRGCTHFRIHMRSYSDQSAFLLGPGMYNSTQASRYRVFKYERLTTVVDGEEKETREDVLYPYPLEAYPDLDMYQSLEISSDKDGTELDISLPWRLSYYGDEGLQNEEYGYRIEVAVFSEQRDHPFVLSLTGDEKESESMGRVEY